MTTLRTLVAEHGRVVRLRIMSTKGSVPREAGTEMFVWADGQCGTIGGGALEFSATSRARVISRDEDTTHALGPELGQCCGGAVTLRAEVFDAARLAYLKPKARPVRPFWIWGAGHVGRALIDVLSPMPGFAITWVDTDGGRFPEDVPDGVDPVVAAAPRDLVHHAPLDAEHVIITYSHEIDFSLCHGLLSHGFGWCGLIGSKTKWARFQRRLKDLGHTAGQVRRIQCPIGDPKLGKHPQAIAVGLVAERLRTGMRQAREANAEV